MAQTAEGALKASAARAGVSVAEYLRNVDGGLRYCWRCQEWQDAEEFGMDRTRAGGRASACRRSKNAAAKRTYCPRPGPQRGRRFVEPRDGDQKQARGRINYLVNAGLIPDPNDLPCADCGHQYAIGQRRHEYDHHLGYLAEHHEDVEAVCSRCHHARENLRRAA